MTKKLVIDLENPNGVLVDMTPEEETQRETDIAAEEAEKTAQAAAKAQAEADKEVKDNLKASAKQKLMNGEALTEDEANVMVGL